MMGDQKVVLNKVSNIYIYIDGVRYEGTHGLWMLVMLKRPEDKKYTFNDLTAYETNKCDGASEKYN